MTLTEADAEADVLGLPRPDGPAPRAELGLGTARGDVVVPGEVCGGPCHTPLQVGESYTLVEGLVWCLGCAVTEPNRRNP